jgi:hypothetical protein
MSLKLKIYIGFFTIFFGFALILIMIGSFQQRNIIYSSEGQTEFIKSLSEDSNYIDCLTQQDCKPIKIEGDSGFLGNDVGGAPFSGFADPSIRYSTSDNKLWMAYSWPRIHFQGGKNQTAGIDINLASSSDNGNTWTFEEKAFESYETKNPQNGESGFINSELINLLPVEDENNTDWYSIRINYFLPLDGGFSRRAKDSYLLRLNRSNSINDLQNGEEVTIGSKETHSEWGIDFNFSELSSQADKCILFNEPALHQEDNQLYILVRCVDFDESNLNTDSSNILVFSSEIEDSLDQFKWKYNGQLTSSADAKELGGSSLTQADIVRNLEGELILITTPDSWDKQGRDYINYGCRAVVIDSLDNPKLKRDEGGEIILRASVFATGQGKYGPGSCSYDPMLDSGIILTKRETTLNSLSVELVETGIHP